MMTKTQLYLLLKLPQKARRFIKIDDSGCWIWVGVMNRNGYGRLWHEGKYRMTHRLFWALLGRSNIDGLVLDHLCRNRSCCNPTHLSPVTARQNTHRGKAVLFKNN